MDAGTRVSMHREDDEVFWLGKQQLDTSRKNANAIERCLADGAATTDCHLIGMNRMPRTFLRARAAPEANSA